MRSRDDGFPALYREVASDLRGLAIKRLGDPEEAEDVVQETFLRLHLEQQRAHVRDHRGFVFRVGWRLIIDKLRGRKRRAGMFSPAGINVREEMAGLDERTPETHAMDRETLRATLAAIDALPPQARRVFVLHRVWGKSYAEIADELNITQSTAKKHMVRALTGLAEGRFDFGDGGNE